MFGTKLLALDIGSSVIGIALSDSTKTIAFPREVLQWNSNTSILTTYLSTLAQEEQIALVVLGHAQGKNNQRFQRAYETVVKVLEHQGLKYVNQEEYVSTIEAAHRVEDSGIANAGRLDSIAAQIILERYIERVS